METTQAGIQQGLLFDVAENLQSACPEYTQLNQSLRKLVSRSLASEQNSVLGIVSARRGEGRTTVALGLASALAEVYRRVVYVEASGGVLSDLIEEAGLPTNANFEAYLQADASLEDTLLRTNKDRLFLLLAGAVRGRIDSLTMVAGMRTAVRELRPLADVVVVDLPPMLESEETPAILSELDSVVLVVRAKQSATHDVARAVDLCFGKPLKAVVLNDLSFETPGWIASLIKPGDHSIWQ